MARANRHSFRRRHYQQFSELSADVRRLLTLRGRERVSPALRERLMLVVTAVNRCRYCAAFHTQVAQLSGLSSEEIALLLDGALHPVPEAELPALSYARQWAEAAGHPAPELRAQLTTIYGPAQATAIERVLTMIWIGNLLGNTWDALWFRLSAGRLGQPENQ